ncbi:MAG: DUF4399 domain-containing protein [Proteobacteria bacterium]|uniref:DUF4399 domain-containing protein n=1 Tax=Rudaea sp. TaxID=2136325 RepID=UPI00321FCBDF|nr:DUF4399 domain-containing protein [Pseudomonadota bacterium]
MRAIPLFAAATLLSAGLAFAQDAAKPAGVEQQKAPAGASVFIVSPKDGETVGQEFTVKFGVKGIEIKPAGDPTPGTGHHHLLVDVAELPSGNLPIPADDNHKHYGKGQTEATIKLAPGDHTLQLDFADTSHVQFAPPIVSKKITVHVK